MDNRHRLSRYKLNTEQRGSLTSRQENVRDEQAVQLLGACKGSGLTDVSGVLVVQDAPQQFSVRCADVGLNLLHQLLPAALTDHRLHSPGPPALL